MSRRASEEYHMPYELFGRSVVNRSLLEDKRLAPDFEPSKTSKFIVNSAIGYNRKCCVWERMRYIGGLSSFLAGRSHQPMQTSSLSIRDIDKNSAGPINHLARTSIKPQSPGPTCSNVMSRNETERRYLFLQLSNTANCVSPQPNICIYHTTSNIQH